MALAGDLEGRHDLGDRERVVEEDSGDVPILRVPPDASSPYHTLGLKDLGAAVPEGIDEGLRAAGVPVELHGRPVKVAMMEEELETAEGRLGAASGERDEVGRAEEPVAVDGAQDLKIAWREDHGTDRRALEARPAGLDFKHQASVPASQSLGKAAGSAA